MNTETWSKPQTFETTMAMETEVYTLQPVQQAHPPAGPHQLPEEEAEAGHHP